MPVTRTHAKYLCRFEKIRAPGLRAQAMHTLRALPLRWIIETVNWGVDMNRLKILIIGFAICLMPAIALAQPYPTRQLTMVVPYAAGTGADVVARALSRNLSEKLGQPVIVENKPGAGTNIGHAYVARSKPDGYTIAFASVAGLAANKSLYRNLNFDPQGDLTPVSMVGKGAMVVLATPASGVRSIEDLVKYAKSRPGKVNFGAANTFARVWIEVLKSAAGIQAETILYANAGTMLNDLMGGRLDFTVENTGTSRGLVSSGDLVPLAVTSKERGKFNADVPTLSELGITNLEADTWYAIYAPKGTPSEIVKRLNAEINAIQVIPEYARVKDFAEYAGGGGTPEEMGAFQASELEKWQGIAAKTGIRLD